MTRIEREIAIGQDKKVLTLLNGSKREMLIEQLQGSQIERLDGELLEHLMWGVSTDGILPSKGGRFHTPQELGQFALAGIPGVSENAVRDGNFGVLVVGGRFGGGSAREHAPKALKGAGIDVVIAVGDKVERIFKENCLYSGGPDIIEVDNDPTLVNDLISQLRDKGKLTFSQESDPLKLQIQSCGGLLEFTKLKMEGKLDIPRISHAAESADRPMTAVEKILSRKFKNLDEGTNFVLPGDVGLVETDLRFSYEFMTKMMISMLREKFGENIRDLIVDRESIALFEDHLVWAPGDQFKPLILSQREIANEMNLNLFRQRLGLPGSFGICHTLITEKALALPGQVVIGSDSHTCSAGVLGAFAFGAGATAVASSFVSKEALVEVPETVKVNLKGALPSGVSAKDVMLYLLKEPYIKDGEAIQKVLEFSGDGLQNWSVDELFVLTNMSVEGGAFTGIIPEPLPAVVDHIQKVTGLDRSAIESMFTQSDKGAYYAKTIDVDLSVIEPMIASPGHPTNGKPLSEIGTVSITRAFVGSCTGGKLSDLREVAKVLRGQCVKVPLVVQAASMDVYDAASQEGIIDVVEQAGGKFLYPGCGACIGMGEGRVEKRDDTVIADTNRNFPGRMGKAMLNGKEVEGGNVYLSNPSIVAASAVKGVICSPKDLES